MLPRQWQETHLFALGGTHHRGRRYAKDHLILKALFNPCRNHAVDLVLMIVSAVNTRQHLLDVFSLGIIAHWAEQTVNADRISCT